MVRCVQGHWGKWISSTHPQAFFSVAMETEKVLRPLDKNFYDKTLKLERQSEGHTLITIILKVSMVTESHKVLFFIFKIFIAFPSSTSLLHHRNLYCCPCFHIGVTHHFVRCIQHLIYLQKSSPRLCWSYLVGSKRVLLPPVSRRFLNYTFLLKNLHVHCPLYLHSRVVSGMYSHVVTWHSCIYNI